MGEYSCAKQNQRARYESAVRRRLLLKRTLNAGLWVLCSLLALSATFYFIDLLEAIG